LSPSLLDVRVERQKIKQEKEFPMSEGIRSVVYPVKDLAKAKAFYSGLFGVEPNADTPYYLGFNVGGQDVGFDPNGHKDGATVYYKVANIEASLKSLTDAGAKVIQPVKDIGGGGMIASVRDVDGNLVGLMQQG
jgi:predicted enzyme related to lactoylglutathione lyase